MDQPETELAITLFTQGCAKPRGENISLASPTLCYICHEEGHFARGCTKRTKVYQISALFEFFLHFFRILNFVCSAVCQKDGRIVDTSNF